MEIFFDPINLVLLVAAITVLLWLKSVLGQRTGLERSEKQIEILPPNPKLQTLKTPEAKVIEVDFRNDFEPSALSNLKDLKKIQPDFDVRHFMDGAKAAHEMIMIAFAGGDKKSLKPLLNKTVFNSFENAIDENQKNDKSQLFRFVGLKVAKIAAITIEKKSVSIGVNFESEIISRQETSISTQREHWTFERELDAVDPNWKLAATDDLISNNGTIPG